MNAPYENRTSGGPTLRSRYTTALYFVVSTLTSVGFGNIAPTTDNEKVFGICVMMLGCKWELIEDFNHPELGIPGRQSPA